MKILVIHQNYLMAGQSGGSRFNEMARLWSEAGHEVTVIAGTVDYCTGDRPARYHGRWMVREQDGPVTVWRCHVPDSYGRSYIGRMWAFFAFTLSASSAALVASKPDVVIATSPPLVVAVPGWLAARFLLRRIPLIFEVRDLWPESAVTTGVLREGALLTRTLYGIERWITRAADCVNVLTPAFKDDMVARNLASPEKFSLVANGADLGMFSPADGRDTRDRLGWGDHFVVLYAGAHGRANALNQLLDAAADLRDRPDILIATVGDGSERSRLEQEAARRGLQNIRFHGPQPKELMPDIVNACDTGAAVLQNNPTFRTVYPNKMFDYMACAKPTLLAIDGVARKLLCEEAGAGVFAEPENGNALSAAIRALADDPLGRRAMGNRGREWVLANASREALAAKYLDVMRSLLPVVPVRPWYDLSKRILDVMVASLLLTILLPVIIVAMLAVRLTLKASPIFNQPRLGYRDRPFASYKLRTMTDRRGANGQLLPDEHRLTAFGRFLRASSLDELPQLWNVLKGDMSLVGPRPLMVKYLPRYSSRQRLRHQVIPGITGWAQIHGRNALGWEERFELDLWYVQNRGFWLDLKILAITAMTVVRRDGISQPGHATMPEFLGSEAGASSQVAGSGN